VGNQYIIDQERFQKPMELDKTGMARERKGQVGSIESFFGIAMVCLLYIYITNRELYIGRLELLRI